jgi:hypothetical protein
MYSQPVFIVLWDAFEFGGNEANFSESEVLFAATTTIAICASLLMIEVSQRSPTYASFLGETDRNLSVHDNIHGAAYPFT